MTLRPQYLVPLFAVTAAFAVKGFADEATYNADATPPAVTAPQPDAAAPMPAAENATADPNAISNTEPAPVRTTPVVDQAPPPAAATAPEERSTTTVTAQRRTSDELITDDVVKSIQGERNISGKIGVDTYRRVVTLTGRVSTQGQVDRVGRAAMRVVDRDVEIRNHVRSMLES